MSLPAALLGPKHRLVAVIDCGSSAIRATVAELGPKRQRRVLSEVGLPINLFRVFTDSGFNRSDMDGVVEALARIMRSIAAYGEPELQVVATAAWREAANSDVLIERISRHLDVTVEIITNAEEARLYFEALRWVLDDDGRRLSGDGLMIDIGAGTTVVSHLRGGRLVQSIDDRYGTIRLTHDLAQLHESPDYVNALDRFGHGAVMMVLNRLPKMRVKHLLLTGEEIRRWADVLQPQDDGAIVELARPLLDQWFERLLRQDVYAIAEDLDCHRNYALRMIAALTYMRQCCDLTQTEVLLVPRLRLRDGMLADLSHNDNQRGGRYQTRANLVAAAKQMAARYGMQRAYAMNTARLACQLFDQSQELHHLGPRDRLLLEVAALVHDVGAYINVRSRHKHTYYIISHAELAGLSHAEQELVAQIARYHRRSPPSPSHAPFMALNRHQRVVVSYLSAILRLAYALDVERRQTITDVSCHIENGSFVIAVDRWQLTLERWSLEQRSQWFSEVFGLDVVITSHQGVV